MLICAFDPGNHTGWVLYNTETSIPIACGTLLEDDMPMSLDFLFEIYNIDIVVYETFNLYPALAKQLSWNSFYPVEVIGQIKLLAQQRRCKSIIGQQPSIKKFAGQPTIEEIKYLKSLATTEFGGKYTEHTKDAYFHLLYYLRFNKLL